MTQLHGKSYRVALAAILTSAALALSYLEGFIVIPTLPGVKLGLANLIIMFVFFNLGKAWALLVSLIRVFVVSLLFGSVSSFMFALFGAILSFAILMLALLFGDRVGRVGISVLSASAHVTGQILAASLLYESLGIFSYLPVLLICSLPLGILNGVLLILIEKRVLHMRCDE